MTLTPQSTTDHAWPALLAMQIQAERILERKIREQEARIAELEEKLAESQAMNHLLWDGMTPGTIALIDGEERHQC